jgi:hypothetical protein
MENSLCHPSGAKNFEVAPRFLGKFCTPTLCVMNRSIEQDNVKLFVLRQPSVSG